MRTTRKTKFTISLIAGLGAVGLTWLIAYCDPEWREGGDRLFFFVWGALNMVPSRLSMMVGEGSKPVFCILIFSQWFAVTWVAFWISGILRQRRRMRRKSHGRK